MILARGAEAIIEKSASSVIKTRVSKGYRYPKLDEKLRTLRTRAEAKILQRLEAKILVPKVIQVDEKSKIIELEFIKGKKLSDCLDKVKNKLTIANQIGNSLAKMHDLEIIHGDLTTSNLILKDKVYFIDFGLSFHSARAEDKAVDLHVFSKALQAKHPKIAEQFFKQVISSYKKSNQAPKILKQLEKVERRGRYKEQY